MPEPKFVRGPSTGAAWQPYAMGLVAELRSRGAIRSEPIANAFAAVPRHVFVPRFYDSDGRLWSPSVPLDAASMERVYADAPLVVALDARHRPRSSSTAPWLMATMLEALDLRPGMHTLEIGTGTGYNAALLAQILVDGQVVTVEIDPVLADSARRSLVSAGFENVRVTVGDGAAPFESAATFDRVIVTAGFGRIAASWWGALREGGVLVGNMRGLLGGGVLVIRKESDMSMGTFLTTPNVGFTPLAGAGTTVAPSREPTESITVGWSMDRNEFDPRALAPSTIGLRFILQSALPCLEMVQFPVDGSTRTQVTDCARRLRLDEGTSIAISGDPTLLRDIQAQTERWILIGRPSISQFRVFVNAFGGQHISVVGAAGQTHELAEAWSVEPCT